VIAQKCKGDFLRSPQAIEFVAYSANLSVPARGWLSSAFLRAYRCGKKQATVTAVVAVGSPFADQPTVNVQGELAVAASA